MPRGITQEQVNAAADALVAAGDKPTVEKIRQALGTGLAEHGDAHAGHVAPHPGTAAIGNDQVARRSARSRAGVAHATLTEERNALFAAQSDFTQERKLWEIALIDPLGSAQRNAP